MNNLTTAFDGGRCARICFIVPLALVCAALWIPWTGFAQYEDPAGWEVHDLERPQPRKVDTGAGLAQPIPPPSDAVVLFGGKDLSNWVSSQDDRPASWKVENGYFEVFPGTGGIQTKQGFGDVQLHVEWASPDPPRGNGQDNGNSGVFLMGIYEVQVLDSYNNPTYADGQAGAVYGQNPPLVNATRPPGEWQSYDIFWHRPHFGPAGNVTRPARVTVIHNGIMIQDNFELWGPTEWLQFRPYQQHADRMPIRFQDHGNPVLFRNVWVRDLESGDPYAMAESALDTATLDRYMGRYQAGQNAFYTFTRNGNNVYALFPDGRTFAIEPASATIFAMKHTNGTFTFDLDDAGNPTGFTWDMSGSVRQAKKVN